MTSTHGIRVTEPPRGPAPWCRSVAVVVLIVAGIAGCSLESGLQKRQCQEDGTIHNDGRRICADGVWVEIGSGRSAGESCEKATQCKSGRCEDGTCREPTCEDGILNGNEAAVDCGGSCRGCEEGEPCDDDSECWSRTCGADNLCDEKRCDDGVRNGAETDVDCGGPTCEACEVGAGNNTCRKDRDCQSRHCAKPEDADRGKCAKGTCSDGSKNREETGTDCGGPCGPCEEPGAGCRGDEDCAGNLFCDTTVAGGGECRSKKCTNGKADPGETDVDCGDECPRCGAGKKCDVDEDCESGRCDDGICAEATCKDEVRNQDETDVDCGGSCPDGCSDGKRCKVNADCRSGNCASEEDGDDKTCVAPGCNDGVKNGEETGVDCGGPMCGPCEIGKSCEKSSDCVNENCTDGTCEPSCDDGIQNNSETDIDCGGPNCGECKAGKTCAGNSDCTSAWCAKSTCKVRIVGDLTADKPGRWSNGTYAASCDAYEAAAGPNYARNYVDVDLNKEDRNGIYKIKPSGAKNAYAVYCQMLRYNARGGWTLALISADDGDANWTWNNRGLLTTRNGSTVGSPDERKKDHKSKAYHQVPFEDLMFIYRNDDGDTRWLAYNEVGDGMTSLATFTENRGRTCYGKNNDDKVKSGFEKSEGNVQANDDLCSTDLYVNAKDQDGRNHCGSDKDPEDTFGPSWSVDSGDGCPMDDPGELGSIGPNIEKEGKEQDGRGFGKALGLDTKHDRIEMYVR